MRNSSAPGLALFLVLALVPRLTAENLLVNGGFESPPGIYPYQAFSVGESPPGWTVENGTVEITAGAYWQAVEGAQSLDLNGIFESIGTIYQDVTTIPGQAYKLRFAYAGNPECGQPTLKTANAYWNSQMLTNLAFDITGYSITNLGWIYYEQTVTATSSNSRVRFQATSPTFCGLTLDDVSLTPVGTTNGCVTSPPGLVGWWPANRSAQDAGGQFQVATSNVAYAPGIVESAFDFHSSNQRVSLPDVVAFRLTNSLSIEVWIYLRKPGGVIVARGDRQGRDAYSLSSDSAGQLRFHVASATESFELLAPIATQTWQHVAATLDGNTGNVRLYVNGGLVAQAYTTLRARGEFDAGSNPSLSIGNHGENSPLAPLDGLVDELAVYDRALSTGEIVAIHAADGAGKCELPKLPLLPVPVITSFQPHSASIGSHVTLTGTNFSSVPASNLVFFGAVRATVTAASTNELTVAVPPGATYAPITLSVSGLVAYATQPFQPTFMGISTAEITTASFAPRLDLPGGDGAHRSAIADLDGDGRPDIAVADVYGHTISLFRNLSISGSLSNSSFAPRVILPAEGGSSDNPYGFAVADVDGDGRPDLIACDRLGNHISVYRNISTPGSLNPDSFAPHVNFSVGADPRYARVADLDGDGRPDIVSANYAANTISILRNVGVAGHLDQNSFASAVELPAGSGPYDLAVGDLDGDGKPDLAVVCTDGPTLSLYRNLAIRGALTVNSFDMRVDFPALDGNDTLALGDIDGDEKPDLVFGSYRSETLSVFRNLATPGGFTTNSMAPRVDFVTGNWTHTVALGDLNGDGHTDIASVGELNSYLSVFQNQAQVGTFNPDSLAPRVDLGAGWNAWGLSIGDLDGDGRPDVVFCNAYDDTVSIYQNVMPFTNSPPPTNHSIATPPGLVSWWRGEGDARDAVGPNHGVMLGGVAFAPGMVGQGFLLNGNGSYIRVPADASLNLSNELTLELWYRADAVGLQAQGLVAKRNNEAGPLNYEISVIPGTRVDVFFNDPNVVDTDDPGGTFELSRFVPLPGVGGFHHLAATFKQTTAASVRVQTFLDGQLVRTRELLGSLQHAVSDAPLTIGASVEYPTYEYFQGVIDELSLYNRALSTNEVQQIYAAGSAGKILTIAPSPMLAGPITNAANGHWYYLLGATNWPAAEAIAVSLGGHLATINDAQENDWVFTNFSNFGGQERALWIGLTDQATEGEFLWISGDAASYRNWSPIEPNSGGGFFPDEDCVLIWNPSSEFPAGSWNDAPGDQAWYGVVEIAPPTVNRAPSVSIVVAPVVHLPGITNLLAIASPCGPASIVLDGSRSSDADGDKLQFQWREADQLLGEGPLVAKQLDAGWHEINLRVSDAVTNSFRSIQLRVMTPAEAVGVILGLLQGAKLDTNLNLYLTLPLRGASVAFDRCDLLQASNQLSGFVLRVQSIDVNLLGAELRRQLLDAAESILINSRFIPSAGISGLSLARETALNSGAFRLLFQAQAGRIYLVEATSDWQSWESLGVANDLGAGKFEFEDVDASRYPGRFYRIVSP